MILVNNIFEKYSSLVDKFNDLSFFGEYIERNTCINETLDDLLLTIIINKIIDVENLPINYVEYEFLYEYLNKVYNLEFHIINKITLVEEIVSFSFSHLTDSKLEFIFRNNQLNYDIGLKNSEVNIQFDIYAKLNILSKNQ